MSNFIKSSDKIFDSDIDLVISGKEFRFIRESCGLTRRMVCRRTNYQSPETIGYWEKQPVVTLLQAKALVDSIINTFGSAKYYILFLTKYRESDS